MGWGGEVRGGVGERCGRVMERDEERDGLGERRGEEMWGVMSSQLMYCTYQRHFEVYDDGVEDGHAQHQPDQLVLLHALIRVTAAYVWWCGVL